METRKHIKQVSIVITYRWIFPDREIIIKANKYGLRLEMQLYFKLPSYRNLKFQYRNFEVNISLKYLVMDENKLTHMTNCMSHAYITTPSYSFVLRQFIYTH